MRGSRREHGANYSHHVFSSPQYRGVLTEAMDFFDSSPCEPFPPPPGETGPGVYGIYFVGGSGVYADMGIINRDECTQPIYIGKAVPPGSRTGTAKNEKKDVLGRLAEHARSIRAVRNLDLPEFRCRFMILRGLESDLIGTVESGLIRRHMPIWNTRISGFGIHATGGGRFGQAPSMWDVLHPGRSFVEKLTGTPQPLEEIETLVSNYIADVMKRRAEGPTE